MAEKLCFYRKCPVCGKVFWCESPRDWAWKGKAKNSGKIACSYTCVREMDKGNRVFKIDRGSKVPIKCMETGEIFQSMKEAAARLGVSKSTVQRCVREKRKVKGTYFFEVIEHVE